MVAEPGRHMAVFGGSRNLNPLPAVAGHSIGSFLMAHTSDCSHRSSRMNGNVPFEGRCPFADLAQNALDYFAVNVGQAEIAAGVAVGQGGVIDAELVQHGGVQVVDRDAVLDSLEAELVGRAIGKSALEAAARQSTW